MKLLVLTPKIFSNVVLNLSSSFKAQQFAWVKENYPPLFEKIKQKVKEGRFIPVGGTWVEMDGNIPSGEAFIRQFMYGHKFFMEEFGLKCDEVCQAY